MTTVGVVFQTQSLGRQMKLRHLSQNNQVTTEHPWLAFAETFDSSKEKLKLFETRSPIQRVSERGYCVLLDALYIPVLYGNV